jgi:hypothetical protein
LGVKVAGTVVSGCVHGVQCRRLVSLAPDGQVPRCLTLEREIRIC